MFGYASLSDSSTIEPRYRDAKPYTEGMAPVLIDSCWNFIDSNGNLAINDCYNNAESFSEGLAAVKIANSWGYINKSGDIVVSPKYQIAQQFSHGRAAVRSDGRWHYIDTHGRELNLSPGGYDQASGFNEGIAAVRLGSEWEYINYFGQAITPIRYSLAKPFSNGLAPVRFSGDGSARFGYIDTTGKLAIDTIFDWAEPFSEGLAAVRVGDNWGYIDIKGTSVIEPRFVQADHFLGGVASVIDDFGWPIYIDRKGDLVLRKSDARNTNFFGASGLLDLHLSSAPANARVYVIPRLVWEKDSDILNDAKKLAQFQVPEGNTNTITKVNRKVYYVVFDLNGRKDYRMIDVQDGGSNTVTISLEE